MVPTLETPRLWLRPLELADAAQSQKLFPHWEIVRYLNAAVPWPYPPDGVRRVYEEELIPSMEQGEAWHWTLRLKSDPVEHIGCISLLNCENDNRGFWLGLPWQGQGLMTEACEEVTRYWFEDLGFPVLRAQKAVANTASRRISQASGMRVVATEERDYVCGRLPAEIWEITREEWLARRQAGTAPAR